MDRPLHPLRRVSALVALLAVAVLAACGSGDGDGAGSTTTTAPSTTSTTDPTAPLTVVVLGSSTAAGFGLDDPADGWVERFGADLAERRPGSEVVNLAVPGFTTFAVLPTDAEVPEGRPVPDPDHNIEAALALEPDAVIVNLPSNDASSGVPVDEQMANFATVVAAAEEVDVPVWVTTTQPRDLDDVGRADLAEVRDALLATYGDRAIDVWTGLADGSGRLRPEFDVGDGIHLTPAGHDVLLRSVEAAGIG